MLFGPVACLHTSNLNHMFILLQYKITTSIRQILTVYTFENLEGICCFRTNFYSTA